MPDLARVAFVWVVVIIATFATLAGLHAPATVNASPPVTSAPSHLAGADSSRAVSLAARSLAAGNGPASGVRTACPSSSSAGSCDLLGRAAASVPQWSPVIGATNGSPAPRDQMAMAYDPAVREVILFGGYDPSVAADGDTWSFGGGTWQLLNVTPGPSPPARWASSFVWDGADGYMVLFGGRNLTQFFNDTWTFNGSRWSQINTSTAPAPRSNFALSYDVAAVALIGTGGGIGNVPAGSGSPWQWFNDTWQFSAGAWTNITTTTGGTGLELWTAYDNSSGILVGVGIPAHTLAAVGCATSMFTWTLWAGGTWTNLSQAGYLTTPSGAFPMLTYDTATSSILLFGGDVVGGSGCVSSDATWSFASGNWTNLTGAQSTSPAGRFSGGMAFDATTASVALFGGGVTQLGAYLSDTWTYGRATLAAVASANRSSGAAPLAVNFTINASNGIPPYSANWSFGDNSSNATGLAVNHTYVNPGSFTAVAYVTDSNGNFARASVRLVVWNGSGGSTGNASGWINITANLSSAPAIRDMASMAYDPAIGAVVLFGGYSPFVYPYGDTWLFANGSWSDISAVLLNSPSARWGARMVWDAADGYLLLYGGRNVAQFFNDTWTFSGSTWTLLTPPTAPSPRDLVALTYDAADGYVLLYGGGIGNEPAGSLSSWQIFSDTWSFVGGVWTNRTAYVTGTPGPRFVAGMAYDPAAGEVLLYGGGMTGHPPGNCTPVPYAYTFLNDTWSNVTSSGAGNPPALASLSMVYAAAVNSIFLFGGTTPAGSWCASTAGTYEYGNATWSNVTAGPAPSPRDEAAIAYDAVSNETVLFGGSLEGVQSWTGYFNDTWIYRFPANSTGTGGGSGGLPLNATASMSTDSGTVPLPVEFSVVALHGTVPFTYRWSFGDGAVASGTDRIQHVYTTAGSFSPSVVVGDARNNHLTLLLSPIHVGPAASGPLGAGDQGSGTGSVSPALVYLFGGAFAGAAATLGFVGWRRRRDDRVDGEALVESIRTGGR